MTGAEAIVKCLLEEEVHYVFGYPGVAICPFFDSLELRHMKLTAMPESAESPGYVR